MWCEMAEIVKIENSDFNPEKLSSYFSGNCGAEITTEGILEGWNNVKKELGDDFFEMLKKSPYYIQSNNISLGDSLK